MARKVQVQLIDDLSGEEAQETVRFGVDGAEYEIDLSAGHATELRGLFEQYVAHGRRLRGTSGTPGAKTATIGREETQKIREWAHANGYNPALQGSRGNRFVL
ncbi:histone-like nucleoid-structuring protein Lsr2 [Arthrobacter sp. UYCu723]